MLCITIRLRLGTYDAATVDDPLAAEWPPHPARVFCALVAGDPTPDEWRALRWLEAQTSPEVHAPAQLAQLAHEQFLVTNRTEAGGGSQTHPGRKQMQRVKPRLLPRRPTFHVVWPDAEPSAEDLAALDSLARRVPYLGRVTSDAEVTVGDHVEPAEDLDVFVPTTLRDAELDLRVPYAGYCDRLADAFEDGRHAWEESRVGGYRLDVPQPLAAPPAVASAFDAMVVIGIEGTSRLAATHTAAVTELLRRATIWLVERELGSVPTAVSGHDGDEPHIAFLALPNVGTPGHLPDTPQQFRPGNPHADGRLLGLALAVPRGSSISETDLRRCLAEPVHDEPLTHLTLGRLGRIPVTLELGPRRPDALRSARWTRPSRWWATATPIVLDRFPKPGRDDVAALVADALVTAGAPRPEEVVVRRTSFLPGAPVFGRSAVQRRAGMPVRPWYHAWVRFADEVAGPLLAGSMRYRGLGLFVPLTPVEVVG
jgi:CRISPR-associated protein Csb2